MIWPFGRKATKGVLRNIQYEVDLQNENEALRFEVKRLTALTEDLAGPLQPFSVAVAIENSHRAELQRLQRRINDLETGETRRHNAFVRQFRELFEERK